MKKNEETLIPLLNQGMREILDWIEEIKTYDQGNVVEYNSALISIMNMKRSMLKEYYFMIQACDFLHQGRSSTAYKQELLTSMSLLRVAESLLIQDMEELSEELKGGTEALTDWLDEQIERD